MVRPTNYRIRFAINRLVRQYKTDEHSGDASDCPLCQAVGYGAPSSYDTYVCNQCPNAAFGTDPNVVSCIVRTRKFKNLDMSEKGDYQRLITFWSEVYAVIPNDRKVFRVEDHKVSILKIAKRINKLKSYVHSNNTEAEISS